MKPSPSYRNQFGTPKKLPTILLLLLLRFISISAQATYPEECKNYAPPAIIKGNKIFVSTTGEYLPIKGINYYPRPNAGDLVLGNSQDFYTEAFRSSWERDIAQFKALGVNAIRLYAVDPGLNHDAFMCALKAAGIYVIVGLAADCENCAVQWQDPPLCYPQNLKDRGEFIIQQFARYENVLGFSAGNEIALSAVSYLGNLPCQKKFLRDMRSFVKQCSASGAMRHIPVGIIFADHEREVKAKYYNCRTNSEDELENAEFVGINAYLHCDGAATDIDHLIGYKTLLAGVASWGMTIPVMWTEFGCLNPSFPQQGEYKAQRNFLQIEALFSPQYRKHFNGGFVFEYSTEKVYSQQFSPYPFTNFGSGNYGVGYFSPENCNGLDVPCEYIPFPQFQSLSARYQAVDVSNDEVTLDTYNPPLRDPPACPDRIPALSAFSWPTEFDVASTRIRQCPVLVPVYCFGVPGDCVTVPHPGEENEIRVPTEGPTTTVAPATAVVGPMSVEPPTTKTPTSHSPTNTESSVPTTAKLQVPSASPSLRPTRNPTETPTPPPPTEAPRTQAPTNSPTEAATTLEPTFVPTTRAPTPDPTLLPTTEAPTFLPSSSPTDSPSAAPSRPPSTKPTRSPTSAPSNLLLATNGEGTTLSTSRAAERRGVLVVVATLALGMILL